MAFPKIPSLAFCTALGLAQAPVWAAPATASRAANPSSPPAKPSAGPTVKPVPPPSVKPVAAGDKPAATSTKPRSAAPPKPRGASAASAAATPPAEAKAAPPARSKGAAAVSSQGAARPAAATPARTTPAQTTPPRTPAAAAPKSDAKPPPDQVKKARDLWYRGVDAFRAGNYEEARRAFEECYQIMPKSDVLRNLSISEIQSGHYVSAARHLTQLLSAPPGELPNNVREEATSRLAQAEAQIGQLDISVDVAGAEISVDGKVIGRSPLPGRWYIEPGQHELLISKAGYPSETRQVFALAGVAIPVDVSLETLRRERAADLKAAELMGTSEGQAPVALDGRDEISTASTIVLITTGTIAAASLAAGIVFTIAANGHDSDADGIAERLIGAGSGACRPETGLGPDCELLIQARQDSQNDRERALVGFIGFGVASAATLGYALWLTLDDEESATPATTGVTPSVSLGRGTASINLHGHF